MNEPVGILCATAANAVGRNQFGVGINCNPSPCIADSANDYAALFNSDAKKWNEYGTSTRKHISTINRDLRVLQIRPLMFAVAKKLSVKEAKLAFKLFVFWSVRFLMVGGRGGLLDRNYSIRAQEIASGKIKTAQKTAAALLVGSVSPLLPVFRRVWHRLSGAVDDLDRTSAPPIPLVFFKPSSQFFVCRPERADLQARPGLAIRARVLIGNGSATGHRPSLDSSDGLPAGAAAAEHLPQEGDERHPRSKHPAVPLAFRLEQRRHPGKDPAREGGTGQNRFVTPLAKH